MPREKITGLVFVLLEGIDQLLSGWAEGGVDCEYRKADQDGCH